MTRRSRLGPLALLLGSTLFPPAIGVAQEEVASPEPAPAPEGPRLVLPSYRVMATDQFYWLLPIQVVNPLSVGIYSDSLICEVEDLDPTLRGQRPRPILSLDAIRRVFPSLSAGDSGIFNYQGPALAEHARLHFRYHAHTAEGASYVSAASVEIFPGPVSRQYSSRFLVGKKDTVEYVLIHNVWPTRPSPALLVVHGDLGHARRLLSLAWDLANHRYTVMVVSLPGHGRSSGEPDFCGPATMAALARALDALRRAENVDSTRVGVWGFGRGATAASLLGARRSDLRALVLQSGFYDLWATYRETNWSDLRDAIRREAGPDSAAWRARSPLAQRQRPTMPMLVLHGDLDRTAPLAQARAFAAALGERATLRPMPGQGHVLPPRAVQEAALEFLDPILEPEKYR